MLIEKPEDLDQELASVQAKNRGVGYDDPKATPEEKPVEQPVATPADSGDGKPAEAAPAKPDGGVVEPPKPQGSGDEGGSRSASEDLEPPARSERHIPIAQYKDEKQAWEKEKSQLQSKIDELSRISQKPDDTPKQDDAKKAALEAYAEKHGLEVSSVIELAEILGSGQQLSPEDKQKLDEAARLAQQAKEREYDENEWRTHALPVITKKWPTATPEQIAKARKLLDEVSHSPGFSRTPLPMILNGYEDENGKNPFVEILGSGSATQGPQPKKGMETGRVGAGNISTTLSAKDLNSAKTEKLPDLFAQMEELPAGEKGAVVSGLDPLTYDQYVKWLGMREREEGVEVNRGGQKVTLK